MAAKSPAAGGQGALLDVDALKVTELKAELQSRGLDTSGKKALLYQRLTEAVQSAAAAMQTDPPVPPSGASSTSSTPSKALPAPPPPPLAMPAPKRRRKTAQQMLLEVWQKDASAIVYAHGPPGDDVRLSSSRWPPPNCSPPHALGCTAAPRSAAAAAAAAPRGMRHASQAGEKKSAADSGAPRNKSHVSADGCRAGVARWFWLPTRWRRAGGSPRPTRRSRRLPT